MEGEVKNLVVIENRLRRVADRQGLKLMKSRSRDPRALDYGRYALIDLESGGTIHPMLIDRFACALTLDEVREWLKED